MKTLFTTIFFSCVCLLSNGQTSYYFNGSADANKDASDGANWRTTSASGTVCNCTPTAADYAYVSPGYEMTIPSGYTLTVHTFRLGDNTGTYSDATLNFEDNTSKLVVTDDFGMKFTSSPAGSATNTINLTTGTLQLGTSSTDITTANMAGEKNGSNLYTSKINITGGTMVVYGDFMMGAASTNDSEVGLYFGAGGTLKITGDLQNGMNNDYIQNSSGSVGTIEYMGASQTIETSIGGSTVNYNNLILSGSGTKSLEGSVDINGDLTINGSAVLDVANNAYDITLAGDLTENSSAGDPFIQRSADITFDGSAKQTLSGSDLNFNNFIVNNSTAAEAIQINNDVELTGNLTLTDGHVVGNPSTNWISCIASSGKGIIANASGTQDSSFLKCSYRMVNAVGAPMASYSYVYVGGYKRMRQVYNNPMNIAANSEVDFLYTESSAEALGNTLPAGIDAVSKVGYWTIEPTGASNANLRFYYVEPDGVSDATDLMLVKDDGAGAWLDVTNGDGSGAPTGYIDSDNISSWSDFALGNASGGSNPLPVKLTHFEAINQLNSVQLNWTTETEINSDYFTVERSADGIDFEAIGTVEANGFSSTTKRYYLSDEAPLGGISYYRLTQTDYDGTVEMFDVVSVKRAAQLSVRLSQNPISLGEAAQLEYDFPDAHEDDNILVVLYDMHGKMVYSKVEIVDITKKGVIALDPQNKLTPGIYSIQASSKNSLYQQKLVIR